MPITFPSSPSNGQTHTVGARTWTWSGTFWELNANTTSSAFIGTGNIADSAITSAKIAANTITPDDLDTNIQLGYRNVVINGAMQIAQRGTSTASITAADVFVVDRFATNLSALGTWTMSQENDAPTGSGLRKSLKMLVTTADASPAAGDFAAIKTGLEGQNLQQFLKGTASAKALTMTLWVKSGTTGTFIAELVDADNTRFCSQSYTVNAANTWEKKTLTFPADTTGAFDNDNALSLAINFYLAAGSTRNSGTLQTTWGTSSTTNRATGQVNLAAAAVAGTNYWQITGVQLEAGSVATPFEFEDYGTTLAKCQRYFQSYVDPPLRGVAANDTRPTRMGMVLPVPMRIAPSSYSFSGTLGFWDGNTVGNYVSVNAAYLSSTQIEFDFNLNVGYTTGRAVVLYTGPGGTMTLTSEL